MLNRTFYYTGVVKKSHFIPRFALRLSTKVGKQTKEKIALKSAPDVVKYLTSSPEYTDIMDKIPKSLLRKFKAPESMYLINRKTAKEIVDNIKNCIRKDSPIIEVNPGFGFVSEELLKCHQKPLYLYETSSNFSSQMCELQVQHPGRVTYKEADFFGMWKLAFKDKMDDGNRLQELLGHLCTDDNDRIVTIVGSMPSLTFVKHLINNIVFHNTANKLGRPDLFITMPGNHYEFLTDDAIQTNKHKTIPALFQMLFDYKVLTSVPKVHFLPWMYKSEGKNVTLMDEHRLYLVNITQKEKLPCPPEYLSLLWYFFRPHTFSKSTRIIPMLEQWIPGCGVWLITGQEPADTDRRLAPTAGDAALPHLTIFTEFGDLNLAQKITVFKKFISWPEFEQCQFRVTMENNLPKFVTQLDADDHKDIVHSHDEHSDEHSDAEHDDAFVK